MLLHGVLDNQTASFVDATVLLLWCRRQASSKKRDHNLSWNFSYMYFTLPFLMVFHNFFSWIFIVFNKRTTSFVHCLIVNNSYSYFDEKNPSNYTTIIVKIKMRKMFFFNFTWFYMYHSYMLNYLIRTCLKKKIKFVKLLLIVLIVFVYEKLEWIKSL